MMKLESVYKKLYDIYNNELRENDSIKELLNLIENDIKLDTCYKKVPKKRIMALKNIIKNVNKDRENIKGFGYLKSDYMNDHIIYDTNKMYNNRFVITDSYAMVMINENIENLFNMDLKLITLNDRLLQEFGSDKVTYKNYPSVENLVSCNNYLNSYHYEEYDLNLDDIECFYKLHKSFKDKKDRVYEVKDSKGNSYYYDIVLLKNIIDVIYNDDDVNKDGMRCYIPCDGENRALYVVNNNEEAGLTMPIKMY